MNNFLLSWFDIAVLFLVVGLGIFRGRRNGFSQELFPLFQWIAICVGCAFAYEPLGSRLSAWSGFSLLICYLLVYVILALLIVAVFSKIKRLLGEKLASSDTFGGMEYYLGILGAMIRFSLMIIVFLAIFNSKVTPPAEVAAKRALQIKELGRVYFPPLGSIQEEIFEHSYTGKFVRQYAPFLLIKSTVSKAGEKEAGWQNKSKPIVDDVMKRH
jgi:uncharacterized membrane protein required for colicin V production